MSNPQSESVAYQAIIAKYYDPTVLVEAASFESLERIPDMKLAQLLFFCSSKTFPSLSSPSSTAALPGPAQDLLKAVEENNMTPFYEYACKELGWPLNKDLHARMRAANTAEIARLDEAITEAEKSGGEADIRTAQLKRANYLSKIGNKDEAVADFRRIYEKTTLPGARFEILFHLIRIGFFFRDTDLTARTIERTQSLLEDAGDWDNRNRLKAYRGLHCLTVRDFTTASQLLLETTATYACAELLSLRALVAYAVLAGMLALKRPQLRDQVVRGPEVTEVLHALPDIKSFLHSFYDCEYAQFFRDLLKIEEFMKQDRYLQVHVKYYIREMRIAAYSQLLESYSSLRLSSMADTFGVSVEFIERELARFIAAGRLPARIDQVGGVVETMRPDEKNRLYQSLIKQGDLLLNRLQKLSRVINI